MVESQNFANLRKKEIFDLIEKKRLGHELGSSFPNLAVKLRSCSVFQEWIMKFVLQVGGGFKILNWSDENWVNNDFIRDHNSSESAKNTALYLQKLSTKQYVGTYLVQLYMMNYMKYLTQERLAFLDRNIQVVRSWDTHYTSSKNANHWQELVTCCDLWKEVPDCTFVAFRWLQSYSNPLIRYRVKKIDGIQMNGPQLFTELKKHATSFALEELDAEFGQNNSQTYSQVALPQPIEVNATENTPQVGQKRKQTENFNMKVDTVMKVYLHSLVAHAPIFYEKMDFRNVCTERMEAFLARLKHVVLHMSNRDLESAQVMREVLIRHHFKKEALQALHEEDFKEKDKITSISRPSV